MSDPASRAMALRQILAVQALELRKRFLGKRAIPVYLIALIPVVMFVGRIVAFRVLHIQQTDTIAHDRVVYAALFRTLILRFTVYFGSVFLFVPLFRGDILDRSLHYYFLVPMRRQTLTLAKYLSGLLAALVLFNLVTLATWSLSYLFFGTTAYFEQLASVHGLAEIGGYLLVTTLAVVGYGAVFLTAGVFFKNPIVPAVVILGWESINALLPPVLKKVSVIHYLESLCPVAIPPDSPIQILADPASPWVAIPGILGLAAVLLILAAWRVNRLEILYGVE